jgi:cytochrome b
MKRILVWDAPVRLAHGLLAVLVLGAFGLATLTSDESVAFSWHAIAGLVAVVVVLLRVLWGFFGTRYARFGDFPLRPSALVRYLRSVLSGRPEGSGVGHNAATSWFALAIFAGIAGLGVTGFLAGRGSEGAEEVHEVLAWSVIGLVAVHVAGVLLHVVRKRENLIAGMIDGRKVGSEADAIPGPRAATAVVSAGLVIAIAAALVSGFDAPSRRLKLPLVGTVLSLGEAESENGSEATDGAGAETPDDERDEDGEDEDGDD